MKEPITKTIREGYATWRNNLVLGVPHILSSIISAVIFAAIIFISAFSFALTSPADFLEREKLDAASLILPLLIIFIGAIVLIMVNSFFSAGAIGMSIKAIHEGGTNMQDMTDYGGKYFSPVFLSTIAVLIISVAAGIILFLPSIIAFYLNALSFGISLLIIGTIIYSIFLCAVMAGYSVAPIAIVSRGIGATEGLAEGINFLRNNKLKIFLFWSTYFFASQAASLAFNTITGPLYYLQIISPGIWAIIMLVLFAAYMAFISVTLVPIAYVWITRIYSSETSKIKKVSAKPYVRRENSAQSSTPQRLYI